MSNIPADLKYTREHEWVQVEGDRARVGITAFAQEHLGDVVFVELPTVGASVTATKPFGVVESVKLKFPQHPSKIVRGVMEIGHRRPAAFCLHRYRFQ